MNFIKKIFVVGLLFLANSSFGFTLFGQCFANYSGATCVINNTLPRPIFCQVSVTGISSMGFSAYANSFSVIYPFTWNQVYVYSYNPYVDPLISASYIANCHY